MTVPTDERLERLERAVCLLAHSTVHVIGTAAASEIIEDVGLSLRASTLEAALQEDVRRRCWACGSPDLRENTKGVLVCRRCGREQKPARP